MRILSFIIGYFLIFLSVSLAQESPHGKDLKVSCTTCHNSESWKIGKQSSSFNHSTTKMDLLGQHKAINCNLCHTSLVFSDSKSKSACYNCHTDIHSQTVGKFCDKCHSPESWIVKNNMAIHQQSRFPLVGVHTITECQKCHRSETLHRYDVIGTECIDCHRKDYMATTKPNHPGSNISMQCAQCHNIFSYEWTGSGFNHSFFPLTLGHDNVDCFKCHVNNKFTSISTECYSCHKSTFENTSNPVHKGGCFSTNCLQCHSTNPGWKPSSFKHLTFPLTAGHSNVDCAKCHANINCSSQSSDCYTCHKKDYDATTNPPHKSECYSTNCIICHTTNAGWSPTSFNHEIFFPIKSGKHGGISCNLCHTNPGNCKSFSCTDCHEHTLLQMNNKHKGISGYSPLSTACYQCHPKGKG